MKTYRFHWRHGKFEDGIGESVEQAFANLGYSSSAIAALDYYEEVKPAVDHPVSTEA
jgi:hypothetical protein